MYVKNDPKLSSFLPMEKPIDLKNGDIYNANIKEKLANNEAILQVNGQDVKVRVEGEVPVSGKATIKVTDSNQPVPVVKIITSTKQSFPNQSVSQTKPNNQIVDNLPKNTKTAVNLILEKGVPLDKESIKNIEKFMEKGSGTVQQKLETLSVIANKRLEFNLFQMNAVHESLNGKSFNQSINDLIHEIDPNFKFEIEKGTNSNNKNNGDIIKELESLKKEFTINSTKDSVISKDIEKAIRQAEQLHRLGVEKLTQVIDRLQSIVKDPQKLEQLSQWKGELQLGKDLTPIIKQLQNQYANEIQITSNLKEVIADATKFETAVKQLIAQANEKLGFTSNKQLNGSMTTGIAEVEKLTQMIDKLQKIINVPSKIELLNLLKDTLQQGSNIKQVMEQLHSQFINEIQSLSTTSKDVKDSFLIKENTTFDLSKIIKSIKKQPNFNLVLETINDQVNMTTELSRSQLDKVKDSILNAERQASLGKEMSARSELMSTFNQIENEVGVSNAQPNNFHENDSYQLSNELLASIPMHSKDMIVTTITKKLSQAAIDFKEVKRDISKNLQNIQTLIETFKQRSAVQVKPLLESTIKQLDQAILRSNFMLYTDMATEKKLMNASSQLADAKKLLAKGNAEGAGKIVLEVKNMMEKLIFKPSDVRVKHFVSDELLNIEKPSLSERFIHSVEHSVQGMKQEPSARHTLEYLRSMGLTYDAEQAHSLVSKGKGQEDLNHSMKSVLLKLVDTNSSESMSKSAENLLQQITGQQLLCKNDYTGFQSMMFSIPYLLKDQLENVKVFINSKSNSEKIDWENCSLYFLLETKKIGDLGILLTSNDRNLSFTLKNDRLGFKEKVEPLAVKVKERLTQMGYSIGNIQFTRLTSSDTHEGTPKTTHAELTKNDRGYDFTI